MLSTEVMLQWTLDDVFWTDPSTTNAMIANHRPLKGVIMNVEQIAEALVERGQTVSVAEADTCGLIGYTFSTVAGSSRWFPGGVIAYTGGLKQSVLGVPDEVYETKGSVSPEVAIAMATGARDLTRTDYAVSVTGVAGPTGGRSGLPIGTFYIGVAGPDGLEVAERIHTDAGDRDGNKRQATDAVIDLLGREMGIEG